MTSTNATVAHSILAGALGVSGRSTPTNGSSAHHHHHQQQQQQQQHLSSLDLITYQHQYMKNLAANTQAVAATTSRVQGLAGASATPLVSPVRPEASSFNSVVSTAAESYNSCHLIAASSLGLSSAVPASSLATTAAVATTSSGGGSHTKARVASRSPSKSSSTTHPIVSVGTSSATEATAYLAPSDFTALIASMPLQSSHTLSLPDPANTSSRSSTTATTTTTSAASNAAALANAGLGAFASSFQGQDLSKIAQFIYPLVSQNSFYNTAGAFPYPNVSFLEEYRLAAAAAAISSGNTNIYDVPEHLTSTSAFAGISGALPISTVSSTSSPSTAVSYQFPQGIRSDGILERATPPKREPSKKRSSVSSTSIVQTMASPAVALSTPSTVYSHAATVASQVPFASSSSSISCNGRVIDNSTDLAGTHKKSEVQQSGSGVHHISHKELIYDLILSTIRAQYEEEKNFDLKLIAADDNIAVPAHAQVIGACSPMLKDMLSEVGHDSCDASIIITNTSGPTLRALVSGIYTGSFPKDCIISNVMYTAIALGMQVFTDILRNSIGDEPNQKFLNRKSLAYEAANAQKHLNVTTSHIQKSGKSESVPAVLPSLNAAAAPVDLNLTSSCFGLQSVPLELSNIKLESSKRKADEDTSLKLKKQKTLQSAPESYPLNLSKSNTVGTSQLKTEDTTANSNATINETDHSINWFKPLSTPNTYSEQSTTPFASSKQKSSVSSRSKASSKTNNKSSAKIAGATSDTTPPTDSCSPFLLNTILSSFQKGGNDIHHNAIADMQKKILETLLLANPHSGASSPSNETTDNDGALNLSADTRSTVKLDAPATDARNGDSKDRVTGLDSPTLFTSGIKEISPAAYPLPAFQNPSSMATVIASGDIYRDSPTLQPYGTFGIKHGVQPSKNKKIDATGHPYSILAASPQSSAASSSSCVTSISSNAGPNQEDVVVLDQQNLPSILLPASADASRDDVGGGIGSLAGSVAAAVGVNPFYYNFGGTGAHKQQQQLLFGVHAATRRRKGCGRCDNCLREVDCGQCRFCKDKSKFGGPNKLKQVCIRKRCLFNDTKNKSRCGACTGCRLTQDCQECSICLENLKLGPSSSKRQMCEMRICDQIQMEDYKNNPHKIEEPSPYSAEFLFSEAQLQTAASSNCTSPEDMGPFPGGDKKKKKKSSKDSKSGTAKPSRARTKYQCNQCWGCNTTSPCASCVYCNDMPKHGGEGRFRQKCVKQLCILHPRLQSNKITVQDSDVPSQVELDSILDPFMDVFEAAKVTKASMINFLRLHHREEASNRETQVSKIVEILSQKEVIEKINVPAAPVAKLAVHSAETNEYLTDSLHSIGSSVADVAILQSVVGSTAAAVSNPYYASAIASEKARQVPDLHPISSSSTDPLMPSFTSALNPTHLSTALTYQQLQQIQQQLTADAASALMAVQTTTANHILQSSAASMAQEDPKEEQELDVENIDQPDEELLIAPTDLTSKSSSEDVEIEILPTPAAVCHSADEKENLEVNTATSASEPMESVVPASTTNYEQMNESTNESKKDSKDAVTAASDEVVENTTSSADEEIQQHTSRKSRAASSRSRVDTASLDLRTDTKFSRTRSGRKRSSSPLSVNTRAKRTRELPFRRTKEKLVQFNEYQECSEPEEAASASQQSEMNDENLKVGSEEEDEDDSPTNNIKAAVQDVLDRDLAEDKLCNNSAAVNNSSSIADGGRSHLGSSQPTSYYSATLSDETKFTETVAYTSEVIASDADHSSQGGGGGRVHSKPQELNHNDLSSVSHMKYTEDHLQTRTSRTPSEPPVPKLKLRRNGPIAVSETTAGCDVNTNGSS